SAVMSIRITTGALDEHFVSGAERVGVEDGVDALGDVAGHVEEAAAAIHRNQRLVGAVVHGDAQWLLERADRQHVASVVIHIPQSVQLPGSQYRFIISKSGLTLK